ncbi:adenosylcobinamide-GDP ribazoletransferase [Aquisediminimonas sediminicola]|uniref:adenosylcobinamide-GDP ribazoletransferase n=1 Tax=Alteraquisediminimonas sediminicola TaxID=2676787 RepID=UPI001C8E2751|nr:adenosylcobinamide-GDP ribazoletransferase [Aquisediminimonas sediminicola]
MSMARLRWWMPPLLALQFLTRIPAPGLGRLDHDDVQLGLTRAVVFFPLVGGLVGGVTATTLMLADSLWPRAVAVILALMVEARLTGAFHEDAVADFCDGFGGGMTPERIHDIMKDSRIGSYGALALLLAVGLRATLLIAIPAALLLPALLASACFGRLMAVIGMAVIPPLDRRGGIAKDIGARMRIGPCLVATLWALPFLAPLALTQPAAMFGACAAMALFMWWFRRALLLHLGGVTGDCLGFAVYAGQLAILLAVAGAWT